MKKNRSKMSSAWSPEADRRFTSSDLGKEVLELLTSGSRSQRRLSELILRDPVFVATHGIEDLAKSSGISPSTISRYVRDLGLSGFSEFRAGVAETVHELIAPVAKLSERMAQPDPERAAAAASLAAAALSIETLTHPETANTVRAIVHRLKNARYVWVMGFGLSAHLAAMLALGLQPYREGVVNVVQYGGTEVAAGRLMSVGPDDVVIALTFPRYSSDVIELTQAARGEGAHIVALTDSVVSPLAKIADDLLLAPSPHPVLSSSSLPALAIIEALVSEFLISDPAHIERARRLAAAMSSFLSSQG